MQPALFLDRDGIINVDFGYVYQINDLQLIPGIIELITYFNKQNYYVFVITNQSGIARGYYTAQDVETLHHHIQKLFASHGAIIDDFYYCPHHPLGVISQYAMTCNCRKPNTGMILQALTDYPIDLKNSFLIGDQQTDIAVAQQLQIPSMLFTGTNIFDFFIKNKNSDIKKF